MSDDSISASNDLVRWLKLLALPRWARLVLALIMLLILCSALGLLVWAVLKGKFELISSAVAVLTVGVPIGLIVVALVFGDGGASKLKELTQLVLLREVSEAIFQNHLSSCGDIHYKAPKIVPLVSGCVADYTLSANRNQDGTKAENKPIHGVKADHVGVVFIKNLGNDFLLNPGERLYFAQDLAFFIRGLLNVELRNA